MTKIAASGRLGRVVVTPPRLDQHPGFSEGVENLAVQQLIPQRAVEALVVAVLPWRARGDVERLHADLPEPGLDGGGDELTAIVRPDMRGRTTLDEQLGQRCQYVFVFELARDDECQALPARLVDNGKDAELASVMGAFLDEVVSPDMPRILRPQPDVDSDEAAPSFREDRAPLFRDDVAPSEMGPYRL